MAGSSHDHTSQYLSDARKRGCLACSSKHCPDSLRIPIGMRRPSTAREALRLSPLMKERRAHASGVERFPLAAASAEPLVIFAGRPTAERAADARRFRSVGLLILLKLAVWNDDRIVRDRTHARRSRSARCPPNAWIVLVPATTSPPWRTPRGIRYSSPALTQMRFPAISNV